MAARNIAVGGGYPVPRSRRSSPPSFLAYDDYGDWPSIGAALLARRRVLRGNFRRVFAEVAAV